MRLPEGVRSDFVVCNGIKLHVVHNGSPLQGSPLTDERPVLLCLHGFPEFWITWENLVDDLG